MDNKQQDSSVVSLRRRVFGSSGYIYYITHSHNAGIHYNKKERIIRTTTFTAAVY